MIASLIELSVVVVVVGSGVVVVRSELVGAGTAAGVGSGALAGATVLVGSAGSTVDTTVVDGTAPTETVDVEAVGSTVDVGSVDVGAAVDAGSDTAGTSVVPVAGASVVLGVAGSGATLVEVETGPIVVGTDVVAAVSGAVVGAGEGVGTVAAVVAGADVSTGAAGGAVVVGATVGAGGSGGGAVCAKATTDGPSPIGTAAAHASMRVATRRLRHVFDTRPDMTSTIGTDRELSVNRRDASSHQGKRDWREHWQPPFTSGSRHFNTMFGVSTAGPDLSTLLPGYTLERELGRGAMGIVYLARHESLGRLVAVKELQGTLASDPATRSRFVVEAKVMASMDHPHVVPVYDFIERDDRCALVMEQLPGGTVWDRFVADGYSMPHATAITLATCSAMQHAHEGGILHRDIKPENLMFDATGFMKVTDFGIARVVNGASTKATAAGTVLGTPAYMAPEQAEGKDVGAPADVYATATMYYEMLSGRLPFDRAESLTGMLTQRILNDPTPLSQVAPHVPTELADAAMRGLARNPGERTPSADLFGREIAQAAADAWGVAWLEASPIMVAGSDSIEQAARTTSGKPTDSSNPRSTMLPGSVTPPPTGASETILPGTTSTPIGANDTVSPTSTPTDAAPPPDESPTHQNPEVAAPATPPPPAEKVKPKPSDRDVGRAKPDDIDQLFDISEILKAPPRPVAQYLVAAAFFVAASAWAWFGNNLPGTSVDYLDDLERPELAINGETFGLQPFDIDLTEPMVVSGARAGDSISVNITQLGAPVGTTDTQVAGPDGSATLDTGFIGRVTSGAFDGTVSIGDGTAAASETAFDATATNPWFLTAAGIISVILVLFAVAGIESYLRAFRRGRSRLTSFVGLLATGALLGASAAAACTIALGTDRSLPGLIGPAVLGSLGALTLGFATRANRKRRRAARQELRHTAIKALAKR